MTLTRANTEFLLEARVGPLLTAAGMDGTTVNGTNFDLNGPIGRAIRVLGHTVTRAVLVADADVAAVTDAETDEFLDAATLHALEAILGNLDDVDVIAGPRSERLSQLAAQVERKIERLREAMADEYGVGLAIPEVGVITTKFAEHD